jgi:predicted phosphoribosyltransferase
VVDAELVDALRPLVDELVAVIAVPGLYAVGAFYDDFDQLSDADVQALLGLRPEA